MREPYMRDKQEDRFPRFFSCVSWNNHLKIRRWESAVQNDMKDIHFGKMIHSELRKQQRSVMWFAHEMGSTRCNMYKILSRSHLNSDFILRSTQVLHHDFFKDASEIIRQKQQQD